MTEYDISKAIGGVSDALIMDSVKYRKTAENKTADEKPTKNRGFRKIAGIAVAACLVLAFGLTALAVSGVNLSDYFKNVFDLRESVREETFGALLAENSGPCTSNGVTVTPLAAISDDSMCYISLSVEAPEDTVLALPEDEGTVLQLSNPDARTELVVSGDSGKPISGIFDCIWSDPNPGDNSLNVVITYEAQSGVSSFSAGDAVTVDIRGIWLQNSQKEYTPFLEGDWTIDFNLQKAKTVALSVGGLEVEPFIDGKAAEEDGASITLYSMQLSPLSLKAVYGYTSPDPENVQPSPETVCAVMRDGTEVTAKGGCGSYTDSEIEDTYIFTAPINPDDVAYVRFGNLKISVS